MGHQHRQAEGGKRRRRTSTPCSVCLCTVEGKKRSSPDARARSNASGSFATISSCTVGAIAFGVGLAVGLLLQYFRRACAEELGGKCEREGALGAGDGLDNRVPCWPRNTVVSGGALDVTLRSLGAKGGLGQVGVRELRA